jgi:hypothetical protein
MSKGVGENFYSYELSNCHQYSFWSKSWQNFLLTSHNANLHLQNLGHPLEPNFAPRHKEINEMIW